MAKNKWQRGAELQGKAALLGVPLTCITCGNCSHTPSFNPDGQGRGKFPTLVICLSDHWEVKAGDTSYDFFHYMGLASDCIDYDPVQEPYRDRVKAHLKAKADGYPSPYQDDDKDDE